MTFTPTAMGTRTGAVTITDNAAGSPHKLHVTGTGDVPAVSLTPASLTFASQAVGTQLPPASNAQEYGQRARMNVNTLASH